MITSPGVITLSFEYDFTLVRKFCAWARELPDNMDFVDYWFRLSLSQTKFKIEEHPANRINAFHWTRWKEDFEHFVDCYQPVASDEPFYAQEREWFAMYSQYLVYAFQVSSRAIAEFYGKGVFRDILLNWHKYHTFGADQFVGNVVAKYGLPLEVADVQLLRR